MKRLGRGLGAPSSRWGCPSPRHGRARSWQRSSSCSWCVCRPWGTSTCHWIASASCTKHEIISICSQNWETGNISGNGTYISDINQVLLAELLSAGNLNQHHLGGDVSWISLGHNVGDDVLLGGPAEVLDSWNLEGLFVEQVHGGGLVDREQVLTDTSEVLVCMAINKIERIWKYLFKTYHRGSIGMQARQCCQQCWWRPRSYGAWHQSSHPKQWCTEIRLACELCEITKW